MFLGTWNAAIGPTGHTGSPPAYRPALRDGVVITRGFDGCLQGFAPATWLSFAQRVSALPLGNAEARSLRRLLFGAATHRQLDARGRFVIGLELRAYAGLANEAVFAGLNGYFEIWSPDRWRAEAQRFQRLIPGQFDLSLPLQRL